MDTLFIHHTFEVESGIRLFELGELSEGSAGEFTSILESGEKVVLWPAGINSPSNQRLLLTDRRLVKFDGKGVFNQKYVKKGELPIGQIVEVCAEQKGKKWYLTIKMGNGEQSQFSLNTPSDTVGAPTRIATQLAITERWVSAIRRLI
jgi:hypothetical protein